MLERLFYFISMVCWVKEVNVIRGVIWGGGGAIAPKEKEKQKEERKKGKRKKREKKRKKKEGNYE